MRIDFKPHPYLDGFYIARLHLKNGHYLSVLRTPLQHMKYEVMCLTDEYPHTYEDGGPVQCANLKELRQIIATYASRSNTH